MPISPLLVAVVLLSLALVACVLAVLGLVRSADERTDRHWEELSRMRSDSGMQFFPTSEAPRELERAIADAVHLAPAGI